LSSLGSLLVDDTVEFRLEDPPDVENLLRFLVGRTSFLVRSSVVLGLADEFVRGAFDEFL